MVYKEIFKTIATQKTDFLRFYTHNKYKFENSEINSEFSMYVQYKSFQFQN